MLRIADINNNLEGYKNRLKRRGTDFGPLIDQGIALDNDRKKHKAELDNLQAAMNQLSKEIGLLFQSGKREEAEAAKAKTQDLKVEIEKSKQLLEQAKTDLQNVLLQLPNAPQLTVPEGVSEEDNEEIRQHGEIPTLASGAKPHWDLASDYNLINFELGVKITGAGFPVYIGKGAQLQRALINFFLDEARDAGYTEVLPPILVNEASGYGTGQLPDKEGQMYHVTGDDLYVIPTGEVPITNIYRDEIISAEDLPIKNCGYTPCFRREAGSYGKDVRGLNRLHQFDKVEVVQITHPDRSGETLTTMYEYVEGLLKKLELPYRLLKLCGGDLGFAAAITYDLEVYSVAQERWLEVSSVSNFESFQANRLKLRYREQGEKPQLAHTLNGSALALPRILAAILENNQTASGIKIPKVLVPYCGFEVID